MLLKYVYLVLFIILLGYIGKKLIPTSIENFIDIPMVNFVNKSENYSEIGSLDIELLTNKDISGTFVMNDVQGSLRILIGKINIEINIANSLINFNNITNIKQAIEQGKQHTFKITLFPVNNFILLSLNDNIVYSNFIKDVGIPKQRVSILVKNTGGSISKLTSSDSPYSLYNTINELYKINNSDIIWHIKKHNNYYNIKNISNGADYSSGKLIILTNNKDYFILDTTKNTITTIGLIPIDNINKWVNYGSSLNIINNKKQYLSGNLNLKYISSGLPSVYGDNQGDNQLIQWIVEDLEKKNTGYYITEGDAVYLKNNGLYLQVIKGNPIPTSKNVNKGIEVSLGPNKNENSKWIIRHNDGTNKLFKGDDKIYLYHPMTESYLYNTNRKFNIGGVQKVETISTDRKDIWTIENIILNTHKKIHDDTIDYYRYNEDTTYLLNKEKDWKNMIMQEDVKVKETLKKFNTLKGIERDLETNIKTTKAEYDELRKTKCPPRKVCLTAIDYNCIQVKPIIDDNSNYKIVYEKRIDSKSINLNNIEKCKTINDIDITQSPYIKSKKYVLKNAPSAKDDNSIESIK
jgi:hypothetical protein